MKMINGKFICTETQNDNKIERDMRDNETNSFEIVGKQLRFFLRVFCSVILFARWVAIDEFD